MAPVATASLAETPQPHVGVNRPNMVQVGTIVWLSSELMFFAGLFAMYFTIRAVRPELWTTETAKLNVPYAAVNTHEPGAELGLVPDGRVRGGAFPAHHAGEPRWKIWTRSTAVTWGLREWFVLTYIAGALFVLGRCTST